MNFLNSYIGMFITQSVLHSFIIVVVIEISLHAWEIRDHLSRFRYRLLTLTLPVIMFPVYQQINPDRGSLYFRENEALLNSHGWLGMKILNILPLHLLFFAFLFMTVLVFFLQEIVPILRERSRGNSPQPSGNPGGNVPALLDNLCRTLNVPCPPVLVVTDPYPLLYTAGVRSHTLVLSHALLDRLNNDQLETALAHEVVHMLRRSSLKTQGIYLFRVLMFYNPVSLLEFRRLVQDDEFLCDQMTVCLTKKPEALASALQLFYAHPEAHGGSALSHAKDIIEAHSHNLLIRDRIAELGKKTTSCDYRFGWGRYIVTVLLLLKINYLVV